MSFNIIYGLKSGDVLILIVLFDKQFAAFLDDDGTIGFIDALSGKIIQRSFFSTRLKGDFRHGRQLFERVEVLRRRLALRDEVSMVRGIDKSGTVCRVPFPSWKLPPYVS